MKRLRAFLLVTLALLQTPAGVRAEDLWPNLSESPKAVGGGEKDAAVIVGAENYMVVATVPGARKNAEDWQTYLTGTRKVPFDKVFLLRDNEATLEKLRRYSTQAAARVEAGGTLWFIFIGHGAPAKDGHDGLLVGADAQQDPDSLYARSLPRAELLKTLSKGRQARTVVLIDACFSGRTPSGEALVAGLQPLVVVGASGSNDPRTILMTAAKSDQFAGPLPKADGSRPAFSYLVLGALRGWAADAGGKVTAAAAVDFASRALSLDKGRTQTPELSGARDEILSSGKEAGPDLAKIDRVGAEPSAARQEPAKTPPNKTGIVWIRMPAGSFTMGEDKDYRAKPAHTVNVKAFEIAKTEVTNQQYAECVAAGACTARSTDGMCGNPDYMSAEVAVTCVTWAQAAAFSAWAGGRLPSEAEWEYAARGAGSKRNYPWGNEAPSCDRAVMYANGKSCSYSPMPVCSKPKGNTAQGLCDMAGNVYELTSDWGNTSYTNAPTDGSAWVTGASPNERMKRGGAFNTDNVAVWSRFTGDITTFNDMLTGFRPVR